MVDKNASTQINKKSNTVDETNPSDEVVTESIRRKNNKESLERYYDGSLINSKELKKLHPLTYKWLKEMVAYGNIDAQCLLIHGRGEVKILLYTYQNEYTIRVKDSWIGAGVRERKALVGEHWTRGSDLPDGDYSMDTMNKISNKILSYEFKNIKIKWE